MTAGNQPKRRPVGPQIGAHAGEPPDRDDGRAYLFIDHVAAADTRLHLSEVSVIAVPVFTRCGIRVPMRTDSFWRVCLHRDLCPDENDCPECEDCFELPRTRRFLGEDP